MHKLTMTLGIKYLSARDFRGGMRRPETGCSISKRGSNVLNTEAFRVCKYKTEVELVLISHAELGFTCGTCHADVFARAEKLGFIHCPIEVGPRFCLRLPAPRRLNPTLYWIGSESVVVTNPREPGWQQSFLLCVEHNRHNRVKNTYVNELTARGSDERSLSEAGDWWIFMCSTQ